MYKNFLKETIESIKENGLEIEDVLFVGTSDGKYRLNWNEFIKTADFEYDAGYGGQEIPENLIVYFKNNTYMFRWEYDGSEWWEYLVSQNFSEEDEYKKFNLIKSEDMWYYKLVGENEDEN